MWAVVRLLLPGVWILWEPSLDTLYAFLFSINVIGFLFMTVLIFYYTGLLVTNTTTYENNNRKGQKYDHGTEHNIKVRINSILLSAHLFWKEVEKKSAVEMLKYWN